MKDITEYNIETYEHFWGYAHYQPPERTPWWPLMKEFSEKAPDRLEIGPGPYPKLPMSGTHVVDLSQRALEMLAHEGAIVHHGLLHQIGFPDASFDLVALFEVLEHIEDDVGMLNELARITRQGGWLVASVPMRMKNYTAWDDFSGHVRRYEHDELHCKLEDAGFVMNRFEIRPGTVGPIGRLWADYFVYQTRRFPRFSLWVFERLLLAAMSHFRAVWRDPAEWDKWGPRGFGCTVVCKRI